MNMGPEEKISHTFLLPLYFIAGPKRLPINRFENQSPTLQKTPRQRLLQPSRNRLSALPSRTKRNYRQETLRNRHLHRRADYPNHPNQNRNEKAQRTDLERNQQRFK